MERDNNLKTFMLEDLTLLRNNPLMLINLTGENFLRETKTFIASSFVRLITLGT